MKAISLRNIPPDLADGYDFVVSGPRWTTEFKDGIVTWAEANGAAEADRHTDGRPHVRLAWH